MYTVRTHFTFTDKYLFNQHLIFNSEVIIPQLNLILRHIFNSYFLQEPVNLKSHIKWKILIAYTENTKPTKELNSF